MRILICAATQGELDELKNIRCDRHFIDFKITGVGMVAAAYHLTKYLHLDQFDLAINCGIAGSFDRSIPPGEVVFVSQEIISELGAEDDENFLSLTDMGLEGEFRFHSNPKEKFTFLNKLRSVTAITVNTVHGNAKSISNVLKRLGPDIETMEGAAFYYVCEKEKVTAIQLRAISNYVEKRNRNAWNIPLALRSLYETVNQFVNEI